MFNIKNYLFAKCYDIIPGFSVPHGPNPFLKSVLDDVWMNCENKLRETSKNKFRSSTDLNQYLFYYWHLCTKNFTAKKESVSAYCRIGETSNDKIIDYLNSSKQKIICINDNPNNPDKSLYQDIIKIFDRKFPNKSSFEI